MENNNNNNNNNTKDNRNKKKENSNTTTTTSVGVWSVGEDTTQHTRSAGPGATRRASSGWTPCSAGRNDTAFEDGAAKKGSANEAFLRSANEAFLRTCGRSGRGAACGVAA